MKPRVTLITLGVDDLDAAIAFYRALGWRTEGIVGAEHEQGAVAFFELEHIRIALWPRKSIAHHTGLPLSGAAPTEFMLAHNVNSKAEVDAVMDEARRAGAAIVDPAHETFWGGYAGIFQDPDRHLWEVAWNPEWKVPG